ncbi:MAG: TetR/AcrR family transcriptional regulator [Candidatus Kapaibacteriota bacterium]|jgi:AcrR family transcriptional regulator
MKKSLLNAIFEEATKQLFAKGYKNLNIDQLVKEIGISKATFYKYIPSKEMLFEECIRKYFDKFRKDISSYIKHLLKSDKEHFFKYFIGLVKISGEFLSSVTSVINSQIEKRFPQIAIKLHDFTRKQIENSFFSIVLKGREIGVIKKEIDYEILYFIIYVTLTNLKYLSEKQVKVAPDKFFYEYFNILFNGILVDEAKQLYFKQIEELKYEG